MFDSFSPLLHLNDDFLDVLNPSNDDNDDIEDWMKPLLFDQLFDHDLQQNFLNVNDIEIKQEKQLHNYLRKYVQLFKKNIDKQLLILQNH